MAPWADTPFKLVPSSRTTKPTAHASIIHVADEMGNAHNNLIRGLNSMYLQAPYVKLDADVHDLIRYSVFWQDWLHHHHESEEQIFFPEIERVTGATGIMSENVVQHHEFLPSVEAFQKYTTDCLSNTSKVNFESAEFLRLIDAFAPKMVVHLADEIETLLGLSKYDTAAAGIKKAWDDFEKKVIEGDKHILFPIVMGTGDNVYEGAPVWPAVPTPVRYLVHYYFERKYRSVWRFNPSTSWGSRRDLHFLPRNN